MSMHMLQSYFTTTRVDAKQKRSKSKRVQAANQQHDQWLLARGLHPNQRELQRAINGSYRASMPDLSTDNPYALSDTIGNGYKRGIMERLDKESAETRNAILDKAARCEVAYNKGPVMYHSPETDMTMTGSKSRRG